MPNSNPCDIPAALARRRGRSSTETFASAYGTADTPHKMRAPCRIAALICVEAGPTVAMCVLSRLCGQSKLLTESAATDRFELPEGVVARYSFPAQCRVGTL